MPTMCRDPPLTCGGTRADARIRTGNRPITRGKFWGSTAALQVHQRAARVPAYYVPRRTTWVRVGWSPNGARSATPSGT